MYTLSASARAGTANVFISRAGADSMIAELNAWFGPGTGAVWGFQNGDNLDALRGRQTPKHCPVSISGAKTQVRGLVRGIARHGELRQPP